MKKADGVITNPPFTMKEELFSLLLSLDKPFMVLVPMNWINTVQMMDLFGKRHFILFVVNPKIAFYSVEKQRDIDIGGVAWIAFHPFMQNRSIEFVDVREK